jgi:Ca-activated chloride channel family protein
MGLERIYKDIHRELEEKDLQGGRRKRYEERFQIFLGIAVLLLLIEVFMSERKRSRKQRGVWWFILLLFLALNIPTQNACAFLLTSKAPDAEKSYKKGEYAEAAKGFLEASILGPEDESLKFNLADSYYKMKNYDEAEKIFRGTTNAGDSQLAQKSFYNMGNTLYRGGKLAEAIDAYKKALELDPKDEDARYNLEFVKREMKRQQDESKKNKQNKTCDNPDDKQKNDGDKDKQNNKEDKKNTENKPDEKKQQEAQNSPEQEKKDAQKDEEQKKASAEKQKESDKKNETSASKAQEVDDKATQMKKQEAMRWLDTLQDDRQQVLKNQMEKNGGPVYRSGKDW